MWTQLQLIKIINKVNKKQEFAIKLKLFYFLFFGS